MESLILYLIKRVQAQAEQLKNSIVNNINDKLDVDVTINAPVETISARKTEEELAKVNSLIAHILLALLPQLQVE